MDVEQLESLPGYGPVKNVDLNDAYEPQRVGNRLLTRHSGKRPSDRIPVILKVSNMWSAPEANSVAVCKPGKCRFHVQSGTRNICREAYLRIMCKDEAGRNASFAMSGQLRQPATQ
jgi:hypothetical protein